MPRLSICIPTRNRANELRRHLEHIAGFGRLDYEVVVSDNCSDDDTAAVAEAFRGRIANLFYLRQERSLTFYETMVAACNLAAGDFAMYAADDDTLVEDGLIAAVALLTREKGVSAVYGAWEEWDAEAQSAIVRHAPFAAETHIGSAGLLGLYAQNRTPELPIFRVASFRRTHLAVQHQYAFDFFGAALFASVGRLAFTPEPIVRVHRHPGQESHRLYRPDIMQCYQADYELFLSRYGGLGEATTTVLATRALAEQYMVGAQRAIDNGEYLHARTLLQRAAVYRPQEARAGLAALNAAYFDDMLAENLAGLIATMPPVERILYQGEPACARIAALVAARTDLEATRFGPAAIATPAGTDFVLCRDGAALDAVRAATAFPLRKARALDEVAAALRQSEGELAAGAAFQREAAE